MNYMVKRLSKAYRVLCLLPTRRLKLKAKYDGTHPRVPVPSSPTPGFFRLRSAFSVSSHTLLTPHANQSRHPTLRLLRRL